MSADLRLTSTRRAAMGAEVEMVTDAGSLAIDTALTAVAALERRWSRFQADSEISRLNAADGPAVARPSTARIIEVALAGQRLTRGWFDPTRGAELRAAGYGASLEHGWGPGSPLPRRSAEIETDPASGLVTIPADVEIDLGGIAKGWTADLAAQLLHESGATHAGVSVGGDLRVRSTTQAVVDIVGPDPDTPPAVVGLRDGGIAVSGPTRRRDGTGRHHLIDPFTRRPSAAPRIAAVIAATAAGAEMIATAAAIAPAAVAIEIVEELGATAWLVEPNGSTICAGQTDRFLLEAGWLAP